MMVTTMNGGSILVMRRRKDVDTATGFPPMTRHLMNGSASTNPLKMKKRKTPTWPNSRRATKRGCRVEPARIGPNAGLHVRILEQHVSGAGEEMPQQEGLSRSTRPGEHYRRKAPAGLQDLWSERASDEVHMRILR